MRVSLGLNVKQSACAHHAVCESVKALQSWSFFNAAPLAKVFWAKLTPSAMVGTTLAA
jgi:hypothetical protein